MKSKKIKAITDADVPLEIAEKSLEEKIRGLKPVWVSQKCLKSSKKLLYSYGFSSCQGICYSEPDFIVGAIARNHPKQDPYYTLTGDWANGENLEDPKKIFTNLSEVVAVHVYNINDYCYPENWISGSLERIGITNLVHVPIKSHKPGKNYWMSIAHDVPKGLIYIFHTDFDYGLCLDLRKCFSGGGMK